MEDTPLRESEGMLNPYAENAVADAELRLDVEALEAENERLKDKLNRIRTVVKNAWYSNKNIDNSIEPQSASSLASDVYRIIDGCDAVWEFNAYLNLQQKLASDDPVTRLEARLEILEKQIKEQGQA